MPDLITAYHAVRFTLSCLFPCPVARKRRSQSPMLKLSRGRQIRTEAGPKAAGAPMLKLSRGRQIRTEAGPKAAGALMLKLSRGRQIRAEAGPKAAGAREAEDVGEVKDGSNFKESDALRQIVTSQRLRSQKRHVESPKPLLLRCGSLCTRVRACQPQQIAIRILRLLWAARSLFA